MTANGTATSMRRDTILARARDYAGDDRDMLGHIRGDLVQAAEDQADSSRLVTIALNLASVEARRALYVNLGQRIMSGQTPHDAYLALVEQHLNQPPIQHDAASYARHAAQQSTLRLIGEWVR